MSSISPGVALFLSVAIVSFSSCEQKIKQKGLALTDSPIRYELTKFADPKTVAEVGDLQFKEDDVFANSPVLADLNQQKNNMALALIYKMLVKEQNEQSEPGVLTLYAQTSTRDLGALLNPIGVRPSDQLSVRWAEPMDRTTLAQLGQKQYSLNDKIGNDFLMKRIEERIFSEKLRLLEQTLVRRLLMVEADKRGKSLQDFISEVVIKEPISVSTAEVSQHAQKLSIDPSELTPELSQRLASSLQEKKTQERLQTYVVEKLITKPVQLALVPPKADLELSKDFRAIAGPKDAPVSMIVFSGTTCPDCKPVAGLVLDALGNFPDLIKVNWIHDFDPGDGLANLFAEAALCIDAQKAGESLHFLNEQAKGNPDFTEDQIYRWAEQQQLDSKRLKTCLQSGEQAELVRQHLTYAKSVGLLVNPTFWIEGSVIEAPLNASKVRQAIRNKVGEPESSGLLSYWKSFKSWLASWV